MSLIQRVLQPWLLLDFFYKFTNKGKLDLDQKLTLRGFSSKVISSYTLCITNIKYLWKVLENRKRDKEEGKALDWCLLDAFMEIAETKPDFADNDIIDEVCTFMLAVSLWLFFQ